LACSAASNGQSASSRLPSAVPRCCISTTVIRQSRSPHWRAWPETRRRVSARHRGSPRLPEIPEASPAVLTRVRYLPSTAQVRRRVSVSI
jgi:hypothetical protein